MDDENVALHPFADVESEISEKDDELGVRSNAVDAASIDQSDAADAAKIGVGRLRDTDVSSSAATNDDVAVAPEHPVESRTSVAAFEIGYDAECAAAALEKSAATACAKAEMRTSTK